MMRHRLTARAAQDIASLYRSSVLGFGVSHADRYLDGLEAAFHSIGQFPTASPIRPEFRGRIRIRRHESHYIVYQVGADEVLIVRVLHVRQDIARHL